MSDRTEQDSPTEADEPIEARDYGEPREAASEETDEYPDPEGYADPEEATDPSGSDVAASEETDEAETASEDEDEEEVEPPTPEEVADTAVEFVGGLLEASGVEAEVTGRVEGETAWVEVTGEDLGPMIGRRGQTLDAIQELARTAVQRRLRSRVRLQVDVEGYKSRRRDTLADYARSIAERAKERGTEIELEPMTAYERKIVHDAVGEIEGVSSFSEGEEPNRKVVVRAEEPNGKVDRPDE